MTLKLSVWNNYFSKYYSIMAMLLQKHWKTLMASEKMIKLFHLSFIVGFIFLWRKKLQIASRRLISIYNNLPVPAYPLVHMADGITIGGDGLPTLMNCIFYPSEKDSTKPLYPTLLVRTPYYRHMFRYVAERFAEQGYVVVVQDCRGRYDSEGSFSFVGDAKEDAVRTLRWLKNQKWFDGNLGMFGISYLGVTQWAAHAGYMEAVHSGEDLPRIKAIMPIFATSDPFSSSYNDRSFSLDMNLRYIHLMHRTGGIRQSNTTAILRGYADIVMAFREQDRLIQEASKMLNFDEIHKILRVPKTLSYNPNDSSPFWRKRIFRKYAESAPAAHLYGGWYDIFLRETLKDFQLLQKENWEAKQNGEQPRHYLTIGPWTHFESTKIGIIKEFLKSGLELFDVQLKGKQRQRPMKAVRLFIMHESPRVGHWMEYDFWPPPTALAKFYLHPHGRLALQEKVNAPSSFSAYRYDPLDPTPSIGGAIFHVDKAGCVDNRELEERPDVLTFTTAPLQYDIEVVGPVKLVIWARSSTGRYTDFYGRLCDVHPSGVSYNVCDGLTRLNETMKRSTSVPSVHNTQHVALLKGEAVRVEVDMWATAKRFCRGHLIRLQVSSGAHPRWIRNFGTETSIFDSADSKQKVVSSHIELLHNSQYPSAIMLQLSTSLDPLSCFKQFDDARIIKRRETLASSNHSKE